MLVVVVVVVVVVGAVVVVVGAVVVVVVGAVVVVVVGAVVVVVVGAVVVVVGTVVVVVGGSVVVVVDCGLDDVGDGSVVVEEGWVVVVVLLGPHRGWQGWAATLPAPSTMVAMATSASAVATPSARLSPRDTCYPFDPLCVRPHTNCAEWPSAHSQSFTVLPANHTNGISTRLFANQPDMGRTT